MPQPFNAVDVWEGPALNATAFELYRNGSATSTAAHDFTVDAFSNSPVGGTDGGTNRWLPDGTPLFVAPRSLWYPTQKGYCAASDFDCVEAKIREEVARHPSSGPPRFILAYGVTPYAEAAAEMARRLEPDGFAIIGAQEMADLGRQAGRLV